MNELFDLLQAVETDSGPLTLIGCPITIDGVRPRIRRAPPALGEHNDLLLGPTTNTTLSTQGTR